MVREANRGRPTTPTPASCGCSSTGTAATASRCARGTSRPSRCLPSPTPTPLAAGMVAWFDHAIAELAKGLTEDPAGVAEKPISINEKMTLTQVVDRLRRARACLARAVELEKAGTRCRPTRSSRSSSTTRTSCPAPTR